MKSAAAWPPASSVRWLVQRTGTGVVYHPGHVWLTLEISTARPSFACQIV